jgi:uncharacterized membrane protein
MFRKNITRGIKNSNTTFRLRGHEILRIEAFSDAVFALAVTLLIVSLEVPKSFDELMITMRGFFAFGISFLLLMMIWYKQNVFFRRYGMHDVKTVALNCILIFLVLFYVYPLKFLFTLAFSDQIYGIGNSPLVMKIENVPTLMLIYGVGFILIYLLFFLMYIHALGKREELELTSSEVFDTRTTLYGNVVLIIMGFISIIMSQILPAASAGSAGMAYILIGPAFTVFYGFRAKKKRKLAL